MWAYRNVNCKRENLMKKKNINLEFKDITAIEPKLAMEVLSIRNEPGVRNNMYTDHIIQPDEHMGWIERLKSSKDTVFFAVVHEDKIVGGVSLSGINRQHKRADWAFYLSEDCHGKGIGSALERQFIDMAFERYDIEKLNCEVIAFNQKVVDMHQRFGFKLEGLRRDHCIRDGQKYDAVLLGITKDEWRG